VTPRHLHKPYPKRHLRLEKKRPQAKIGSFAFALLDIYGESLDQNGMIGGDQVNTIILSCVGQGTLRGMILAVGNLQTLNRRDGVGLQAF
jgi:hypothetical protein